MELASGSRPLVVHVITTIARGGAENHLVELIRGQVAAGWSVKVAYLKPFGERYWRQALEDIGVQTVDLGLTRYGQPGPALRLRRMLRSTKPDIVHAHMPPAELYARAALTGLPSLLLVTSKHNDEPFHRGPLAVALERWCAARASRVIAISSAVSRYFSGRWTSRLAGKITTIRYGLDSGPYETVTTAEIAALRASWKVKPDEILVGTVARFTAQKALDVMLRGFAVAASSEKSLKLVFVGQGELEADIKKLAVELGVADRVIFAGFRTDIPVVMRSLDLFALTSDFEGFGLVLLEAMAASKPILATAVSAIPEVVKDGETGILVPKQDHEAFARALSGLMEADRRRTLGSAGASRLREMFSLDVMVRRTLDVYDDVASAPGREPDMGMAA